MSNTSVENIKQEEENKEEPVLEVKDLYTYFYTEEGIVKAVDGVSFKIYPDEILGLVGETGCGKSVTALSIMKLVRPPGKIVKGEILFQGENLVEKTEKEMLDYRGNTITMIFQDPLNSLNPVFKIGDQLAEVLLLHQKDSLRETLHKIKAERKKLKEENKKLKEKIQQLEEEKKEILSKIAPKSDTENKKKTDTNEHIEIEDKELEEKFSKITQEIARLKGIIKKREFLTKGRLTLKKIALDESQKLLERIGIPDSTEILKRYPHELSGGMRQRVMIAMALACNSKLLICDEPTTALDVTIQAQILEFIKELKDKFHNSVLFITHSLGVIYELCDRVAVMYSGNIVEYGEVEKIFKDPKHPYTKGLLSAIPRVKKEWRKKDLKTIPGMVPNLIYPPSGCRFHPRCSEAMQICKEKKPELVMLDNGIQVACHLYSEKINENDEKFKKLNQIQEEEEHYE